MARLWAATEWVLGMVISVALIAMTAVTVIDVVGRYLFGTPLQGGFELSELLMGLTVFAALPLATRAEGHLAIGLLTDRLRGRARGAHRIAILAITAGSLAFIAWRMGVQAQILHRGEAATGSLQLPLWPMAGVMAGLAWLATLVAVVMLGRALTGLDRDAPAARGSLE